MSYHINQVCRCPVNTQNFRTNQSIKYFRWYIALFKYISDWYKRKRHLYYQTTHSSTSNHRLFLKGSKKRLGWSFFLFWVINSTNRVVRDWFCLLLLLLALKMAFLEAPNNNVLSGIVGSQLYLLISLVVFSEGIWI